MSIKTFYSGQYEIKKNKENWKKKNWVRKFSQLKIILQDMQLI